MRTSGRRANTSADAGSTMADSQPLLGPPAEGQPSLGPPADGQPLLGPPAEGQPSLGPPADGQPAPDGEEGPAAGNRTAPARDGDFVQSLDRGLAVIKAFGPDRERLSLSEVARATGLTRAAARRFLLTLVRLGYVRSDGREFSL